MLIYGCINFIGFGTYHCAAPVDYMCCSDQAECDRHNPFFGCTSPNGGLAIKTALGCIDTSDPKAMTNQIIKWSLSLGGLLGMVIIVYAGFTITTASGDPKKIAQGRDLIVAAVTGITLIALAVVILNFIGSQILGISLFGFSF